MNLNDMAKRVTLCEGLKKNLSIAQVKEIMRIVFEDMSQWEDSEILTTVKRYSK